MNWRRGLFRLWMIGAALFVIAVTSINYSGIKAEFDALALQGWSPKELCHNSAAEPGALLARITPASRNNPSISGTNLHKPTHLQSVGLGCRSSEHSIPNSITYRTKTSLGSSTLTMAYRLGILRTPGRAWGWSQALHSAYRLWSSLSERPLCGLRRVYRHRAIRSGAPMGATLTLVEILALSRSHNYCDRERSALGPTDRLRARSPALLSRDCPSALRINASTPGDIDVK